MKTYKDTLIEIKNLQQFAINQQDDNLKMISSIKQHTEGKITTTLTKQKST